MRRIIILESLQVLMRAEELTGCCYRWPGNSTSMGIGSRSGPPGSMSSPMFSASSAQGMPGINMAMSMGSFSGGERFDAYKQPYFKGP